MPHFQILPKASEISGPGLSLRIKWIANTPSDPINMFARYEKSPNLMSQKSTFESV